ncbi:MAG: sigma-54 dependent transcriptional regulator [Wenzhouxiangella sp.]|jgi:two-component system response regulator FlrC|nr:sigma-54 dependent transcriptional regulator [Wenzhouxiangella sp.]
MKSSEQALSILLVEDDAPLREALADTLELEGFDVIAVGDGPTAMEVLANQTAGLVISDIQMKPWTGLDLLARLRAKYPQIPVVLMTAFGSVPQAVQAIRDGAMNYLVKPVESADLIALARRFSEQGGASSELVAQDPRSRTLAALARRVAESEVTVLLSGPSGSGKEAYARYIHRHSPRADEAFVAMNCAAIPESMLEAELFGHEKGAFTGAAKTRAGKFEAAQGGTLLLDEISEMEPGLQAKLLRVLQERELQRLGSNDTIKLNVRVIATTNVDLKAAVADGKFREDLYYRLNVFPLELPRLASRPGDIEPLAERAVARHWRGRGMRPHFSEAALKQLLDHPWPGNVRELDNVIQRALVLLGDGQEIGPGELFFENADPGPSIETAKAPDVSKTLEESVAEQESSAIVAALQAEQGHRGKAARRLGISPRTLRYKLSRLREAGIPIPGEAGPNFAQAQ